MPREIACAMFDRLVFKLVNSLLDRSGIAVEGPFRSAALRVLLDSMLPIEFTIFVPSVVGNGKRQLAKVEKIFSQLMEMLTYSISDLGLERISRQWE
jgi:hypothetical protein